jgi:hypothetical protein
MTFFYV